VTVADSRYQLLEEVSGLQDKRIRHSASESKQESPTYILHTRPTFFFRGDLMYKDTDLILTEAASIANPFKNLTSSCVLHNDSQVSGGEQNLHEREREKERERESRKSFLGCKECERRFTVLMMSESTTNQSGRIPIEVSALKVSSSISPKCAKKFF
jgi:hypothetical protein